jgi:hypothetical protein
MSIPFEVGDTVVPRFIVEWCKRLNRGGSELWHETVAKIDGDSVTTVMGSKFSAAELMHAETKT